MRSTRPRAAALDVIEVTGAREHNLNVPYLVIPKQKLVVFTGVSGSGKSSLAFDTLYAEGQRRYVETLSAYARQFLGQMERPNVERLRGLSPTVAIEQKAAAGNPRSTVGTITEVYDYLRVLYARVGEQRCPKCKKKVRPSSAEEVARDLANLGGKHVTLFSPLARNRKGEFKDVLTDLASRGFARVRLDGKVHRLDEVPPIDKKKKHDLDLVIDRVPLRAGEPGEARAAEGRTRLTEGVELALREGKGELVAEDERGTSHVYSEARTCCGRSFPELSPQSFSFNSPLGMCPSCHGLGTRLDVDPSLVVPDTSLSLRKGAIAPWAAAMERGEGWTFRIADAVAKACKVSLDTPWKKLPKEKQKEILFGIQGRKVKVSWGSDTSSSQGTWGMQFEGVVPGLLRRYQQTSSEAMREQYKRYLAERPCDTCDGRRLREESLFVFIDGTSIDQVTSMTVAKAHAHVTSLTLDAAQRQIAEAPLREIEARLRFLLDVRLDYLTVDRSVPTLSGGEAQRIRLASQLGSELSGVLYVLDEPSIGLHPRDNQHLLDTLRHLRDLGNTVLVVEHDEETIRAADHVVDFGPGAGALGGRVVAEGAPEALLTAKESLTGAYLAGRARFALPSSRRSPKGEIVVRGARSHNLKKVDVRFPLGVLTAVTGVSGAGKSSIVSHTLLPALARRLHGSTEAVGEHDDIEGVSAIEKVIAIDQQPIGRTPRSNPGTYTKAFDAIREIFAQLPEARARGFGAGRFSFNVKGGRCEACSGDGVVKVEMHFLADVYVPCDVCKKRRYNEQTLAIRFKGKNIADVLDSSIDECFELFAAFPQLARLLGTLRDVGLGYMKIGQPAPTMSGGEAQRVKLSKELGRARGGHTLYVLDEPTTGLHFEDIRKLLGILQKLVDAGNTVVVIEHNLDVVATADWIVDLGPEGGEAGGRVVAEGTPEAVARVKSSYTGRFLATHLAALRAGANEKAPARGKPASKPGAKDVSARSAPSRPSARA